MNHDVLQQSSPMNVEKYVFLPNKEAFALENMGRILYSINENDYGIMRGIGVF